MNGSQTLTSTTNAESPVWARPKASPAESLVWEWLRERRLFGWKFRRRQPVAGVVVGFYCRSLNLAIDVASSEPGEGQDSRRADALAAFGVTVLRLSNDEVFSDPHNVAYRIMAHVTALARPELASSLPRCISGG